MTAAERPPATAPETRRLRPGVAVTPLRAGLHLRGRTGSVTLEGSTALPALWQWLEGPLRDGGLADLLDAAEAGPPLRTAVRTLLGELEAHGLLVAGPAGYGEHARGGPGDPVARWLAASAGEPADARAALAGARAEVLAGDPDGPLARAAGRALELGGVPATRTADPDLPGGRVLLRLHGTGPVRALAAGLLPGGGYATAPGTPAQARSDAAALEARLAAGPAAAPPAAAPTVTATPVSAGTPASGPVATPAPADRAGAATPGVGAPGPALAPLLGGSAAHRLLCAAAGLPDPAAEGGDERLLPGLPAVLLAEAVPPRADYRTWLGPDRLDAGRRADLPPAATLGEALRRLAALTDERSGVLPEPLPAELRQLPVPLAACPLPGDGPAGARLLTGAPRLDLARLEAFCRAAEHLLGGPGYTVGANPGHARGRALRAAFARRAARMPGGPAAGAATVAVAEPLWSGHPQFRHWWHTLTARLGVPARTEVVRAGGPDGVYHAVVRRPGTAAPLGEAVEATPGDAAAFAALAAAAAVAADRAGGPHPGTAPPSGGAVAALAAAGTRTAGWEDDGWTGHWLAGTAAREEALQDALSRLAGPARDGAAAAPAGRGAPAEQLRAFGFTVLHTPEEP
ncbi:hypothetical protein ACIPW5_27290 [Streptomyces sp. NPDC090077]|uniref:hypothetical protein n=1 Tax=Streptomyces sp. NPDC090077 TaxID=3365938 RepID=UPI00382EE019